MSKLTDFRDELIAHRLTVYANGTNAAALRSIVMPAEEASLVQDCVMANYARISVVDETLSAMGRLEGDLYPDAPAVSGMNSLHSRLTALVSSYGTTILTFGTH